MSSNITSKSLPAPEHINILVKDLKKATDFFSETLGIGPWVNWDYSAKKGETSRNEPFTINGAWTRLGPVVLEVIEPVEGDSVWSQALSKRGEGLHHICFMVSNWQEVMSSMQAKGCKLLDSGVFLGKHWGYIEISPVGLVVEIGEQGMHDELHEKLD